MKIMVLILLISSVAHALNEGPRYFEEWQSKVRPFYEGLDSEYFINDQGMTLHYKRFFHPENKKTIVIVPGRSESTLKYAEVLYDLKDSGFNFYIIDLQGQGQSDRLLSDHQKGHIRYFRDYVRDLDLWISAYVLPEAKDQSYYLLSHSMGGAISAQYLASKPEFFKKSLFLAPMFQINTEPYSEFVAKIYATLLVKIGRSEEYAPTKGPYIPSQDTFENNKSTHSQDRFKVINYINKNWPELLVAGPTSRWVDQSLKATEKIERLAPEIKIPIKIIQAGLDEIVRPKRQNSFCSRAPKCELIHFPQSAHEVLVEVDQDRNRALDTIKNFFND